MNRRALRPPVVTIGCPFCLQPCLMEFEPGEPQTYWEPGIPAEWLTGHDCGSDGGPHWAVLQDLASETPEYREYERAQSWS